MLRERIDYHPHPAIMAILRPGHMSGRARLYSSRRSPVSLTLGEIARMVDGQLTGNPKLSVDGAAIIRDAQANDLTFADSSNALKQLCESSARAVLLPSDLSFQTELPCIPVTNVQQAFARIIGHFNPPVEVEPPVISEGARISPTAKIGKHVHIDAGATIGNDVEIGDHCTIYPGVHVMAGTVLANHVTIFSNTVLYEKTRVGKNTIIHSNVSIGVYGFGYETIDGEHHLSAQLGNVVISDNVEIGAGTTIDRGTYGSTTIGEGTKIDNQVMIAHNCRIGRHNCICSQVGIAGSCVTGDYVVMGGQVGLRDHVHVGTGARLGAQSGHMTDVNPGETRMGTPSMPGKEFWKAFSVWKKMPDLLRNFKQLQHRVVELEEKHTGDDNRKAA